MERALHEMRLLDQKGVPIPQSKVLDLIQKCCTAKDLTAGRQLCSLLAKNGLDKVSILGNHLIRMFTSCNSLVYANEAFRKVAKPDAYTWNAIISAHAKLGQFDEAFNLYNLMLKADVRPNVVTFLCILKACSGARALQHGRLVHDHIIRSEVRGVLTVENTLLDMYAKSGSLEEAERVFDGVLNRDAVTFGVMLTGYVQHEHGMAALELFTTMHVIGIQTSNVVYVSVLKACIITTSAVDGRRIHDSIVRNGLDSDGQVGSMLIEMYTKCGSLQEAHGVFDRLQNRDIVIWCSLIAGYANKGYDWEVLKLFEDMQKIPLQPERVTFIYIVKACCSLHAFKHGLLIHNMIIKCFMDTDVVVANSLMDMYVKWGDLRGASSIFGMLSLPDAVSWGIMITGYVHYGHDHLALGCFKDMQQKATMPDKPILLLMLKVCGNTGEQGKGSLIHHILVDAGLQFDTVVANALICMYGQFMGLKEAAWLFDNIPDKNVDLWETLIAVYCRDAKYSLKVLELFEKVQQQHMKPSKGMLLCSLQACAGLTAAREGKVLHDALIRSEYELDQVVENMLMNMYGKCGLLKEACNVFDRMLEPNEVSWGSIIDGHVGFGHDLSALDLFERMQIRGVQVNAVLSSSILKACGNKGAIQHGRIIHHKVIINALATTDVWNSLVYFYARCGSMDEAQKVFDSISSKALASWGALLAGHVRHMNGFKALDLYRTMHQGRLKPNEAILLLALQACAMTGALMEGHLVYMQILEDGFRLDTHLGNTLLDMYVRCGRVQDAFYVFSMLPTHDMVSWGVMMAGFVCNSECKRVEGCFESMEKQGLKPGDFIFTSILAACSHAGLLEEAIKYLNVMMLDYGLLPGRKHYSCLSDLLGRAGRFRDAVDLFQSMPMAPDIVLWTSLLDSCETHGNRRLARHCFEELCDADPGDASWYVLMSNICADAHAPMASFEGWD